MSTIAAIGGLISSSGSATVIDTFTPQISFQTPGDLSVIYIAQLGRYARVGPIVTFKLIVEFTPTYTTASGSIRILNLPVQSANDGITTIVPFGSSAMQYGAGFTYVHGLLQPASTVLNLLRFGTGVTNSQAGTTQFPSGTTYILRFTGQYFAV